MDRDEEKDLYIKAKLKDGYIPEKIDNLFNNSAQIIENIKPPKKNKNQIILKRVAGIAACAVIVLGGGNIYATTQGYDNVFFMIKEWVAPSKEAYGKDEILSDRDITISYKSIEVAKGIKMQINRLVVKDNEAKLYLKVDQSESELDIKPFTYIVRDENESEICNYTSTSKEMIYSEELKLDGLKKNAKKLELEVKKNNDETLVKFDIDLENKEIQVIGNEYELQKISEEELKKYLGAFALLNYEDDTLNTGVTDKETLEIVRKLMVANQIAEIKDVDSKKLNEILKSFSNTELSENDFSKYQDLKANVEGLVVDVTDIMYSNGIYTITFTYCYPSEQDEIEDLPVYEMTIGLTINEDQTYSKYCVSSKMESKLVKAGKVEETIQEEISQDDDEYVKDVITKYYKLLYRKEQNPKTVIEELGLEEPIINSPEDYSRYGFIEYPNDEYVWTGIKYKEFCAAMENYMSNEILKDNFPEFVEYKEYLYREKYDRDPFEYDISSMKLQSYQKEKCIYIVEYSKGDTTNTEEITLTRGNGDFVISDIEILSSSVDSPVHEESSKKFVGEWKLDYAIGSAGYEHKISDLYGEGGTVTLRIDEDGSFSESIQWAQDSALDKGKYSKIDENVIKLVCDNSGKTTYVTYSTNAFGETVISHPTSANPSIIEYYSQKDVDIYETKDYFVGDWWRTLNEGKEEEFKYMISIRSDGEFLIVRDNKIEERGTYTVKDNGSEDVPYITLQFNDGTKKQLKLIQGSESYLMTQDMKEQYEYFNSVG